MQPSEIVEVLTMQKFIVDRIEGSFAVCESPGRGVQNIPLTVLPENVCAGDFLVFENNLYRIDSAATKKRTETVQKKVDSLFVD